MTYQRNLCLLALLSVICSVAISFTPSQNTVFFDDLQSTTSKWVKSSNSQADFEIKSADEPVDASDKGLVLPQLAKRYAISSKLAKPVDNTGRELIVQYEVKLQNGLDCGGAYLKLYQASENFDVNTVSTDTVYSIMFGPDKCGHDNRVHFIVKHRNPITKEFEEKLITAKPPIRTDKLSHLYTLHIFPNNTFKLLVDRVVVLEGDFHKDFTPAFNPPKEIDDPSDSKPADWVDQAQIPDPAASKPEDWDESQPARIVDESAVKPDGWLDDESEMIPSDEPKPDEWNEEDDGDWEAPMIPNPKCEDGMCGKWEAPMIANPLYKGKWSAPMIDNPEYKGPWKARQIANPGYFEVENPYIVEKIGAVGIEVWTMSSGILFDNFIITYDDEEAKRLADETFFPKSEVEKQRQAAKEEEEANANTKSVVERALEFAEMFAAYAQENPLPVVGALAVGLLPILVCLIRPSSTPQKVVIPKETAAKQSAQQESSEDDSSDAEESDEEPEEKKPAATTSTTTKRVQKVQ
ncbi:hypothetical protein SAMD00019534_017800 [Acytostelium subglobosum LB1]|uniref:hypothetical protein n=1 Tax=Acytostelium subglobosum LB1 TaxID=1410327 RepID=UPI000644854E|nr:hypothetical protein SAMD00019534_017800 [Acytostelium subglobosum LB1]GAM18605.1 hypothetical protein SAMD00019534_017800 [Acytostelium subglobosum LB1]|eukprot:XP_012757825.1 hypothetical protein SAMD00019534_017800 [Acytostelium subglobosum LB1]